MSVAWVSCSGSSSSQNINFQDSAIPWVVATQIANGVRDVNRESGGVPIVAPEQSYLRVKLKDEPLPVAVNNGLLHFLIDYKDISRDVWVAGAGNAKARSQYDYFTLKVKNIEVKPVGKVAVFYPAETAFVKMFKNQKRYTAVLKRLELPVGNYEYLRVNLDGGNGKKAIKPHTITIDNVDYPLDFIKKRLQYNTAFRVEKGKITSLNSKPTQPKSIWFQSHLSKYKSQLALQSQGYTVNLPIDKIWLNMLRITVTKSTGEVIVLNDQKTRFDLLTLKDHAVMLVANVLVPTGDYSHFTITLDNNNAVELEGAQQPLQIVNSYNTEFRIDGPFVFRGGRISELILDFDPNISVHKTLTGYVLEPDIQVISHLSMTPAQDIRIVAALGSLTNAVVAEAELIFQGSVNSLASLTDQNLIYTDLNLSIQDPLRGDARSSIPLRVQGGSYNGLTLNVAGVPEYKLNEPIILFLRKYNNQYGPVKGELGKITLADSGLATTAYKSVKWHDSLYDSFPIVPYKVNSDSFGGSDAKVDAIRSASRLWGVLNAKSHFKYSYAGLSQRLQPFAPANIACSDVVKKELKKEDNLVFLSSQFTPYCTGPACTLSWRCENEEEFLHFDIQVNNNDYMWSVGTAMDGKLELKTVLSHAFGHALGLNHCLSGDTQEQCVEKVDNNIQNPDSTSMMYRFFNPAIIKSNLSSSDLQGIVALYGTLTAKELEANQVIQEFEIRAATVCNPDPCLLPELETLPKYGLSLAETNALVEHKQRMQQKGLFSREARLIHATGLATLYQKALSQNGIPAEKYMLASITKMGSNIAQTDTVVLEASRQMLAVQIQNRQYALTELRNELDTGYIRFVTNEIKVLIQIRREMINEQARR